ncbi:MAG: Na/Pi symporter [Nanoarchaeota archaeon]|nr:Na/Pi symporter [Nanoarchaeota archaeon]
MNRSEIWRRVGFLTIVLYLFLLSIKLMGLSFKLFGTDFAEQLISFTTNPIVGLFIGILATAVVQSSSVTTSIIVGLTATGALTIGNAIPMIMGANIGTSVTAAIVSLGHITRKQEFRKAFEVATVHDFFNFIVVLILFPLELFTHFLEKSATWITQFLLGTNASMSFASPLDVLLKPVSGSIAIALNTNPIAILILSFIMLFFSLKYFVKIIKPLAESEFKHLLNKHIFSRPLRSFGVGLVLTGIVQSSSVTTSLVVPLAGVGILTLDRIFPYIMGANIGTTVTSIMASLVTGSPAAVTVAIVHFLFNSIGCAIISPIRQVPIAMSRWLANLSFRSLAYPFGYVVSIFYILPGTIIYFLH